MEEWIRLGSAFLQSAKVGEALDPEGLALLLLRRGELLDQIQTGESMDRAEAEAALRLRVLEEELLRRTEQDLERRRRELEALDQTRRALRGYGEERDATTPPSRFIDTRS
jgi:hypothetical protein